MRGVRRLAGRIGPALGCAAVGAVMLTGCAEHLGMEEFEFTFDDDSAKEEGESMKMAEAEPELMEASSESDDPFEGQLFHNLSAEVDHMFHTRYACPENVGSAVASADFTDARVIDVDLGPGQLEPKMVRLTVGNPYVLRLNNGDGKEHMIEAPEFFHSIAVESVNGGEAQMAKGCIEEIAIPSGETAEVRLIALSDGTFRYRPADFILAELMNAPPSGLIVVEQPYAADQQ